MIRAAARAHELILYDLLARIYQSRAARARGRRPVADAADAAAR
jgi:hypothetical protein